MALKIHLPLINDIKNIGVSDTQPLIMGTGITYAAGKIGNAIKFPNSCTSCVHMPGLKLQVFSWAAWFKVLGEGAGTSQRMLSEGRDTGSVGTNIWVSKAGTQLSWSTHKKSGSVTIELNRWYHVVLTADGTNIKLYLDGALQSTTPYTEDSDYAQSDNQFVLGKMSYAYTSTDSYFPFNGQLNDVRVYDECLSAAIIHEIAQGLVLHYKLDGFMGGTNSNLTQGSKNLTIASATTNCNISKRGAAVFETRTDGFTQIKGTAAWQGFSLWSNSLNLKVGTTYTYSFYGYTTLSTSTNAGISFYPMMYNSAGTRDTSSTLPISVMGGTFTNSNAKQIGKLNTTPQLYWATFTWNQTMADIIANGGKIELSIQIHGTFDTGRIDYLWAPKLELGDKPTTWTPSIEEMGIDTTKIEDSSGYNHNGTIVGSVVLAADTARYGVSTCINGAGVITAATPGADIRTLSCWVKTTKNKSTPQMLIADSASNMCISFYAGAIIGVFGATRSTGSKCTLGASYKENDWNHIVVVKTSDDGQRDIYCNGEKLTPAANGYWGATAGFYVGNRNGTVSGNTPFFGYISDVRAYCTPLLDTDIKQLYNVGMKVDNLGGIHTFELNESGNNRITKTGILEGNLMGESEFSHYLKYDSNIYIEPDGSAWVKIYHHNNPKNGSFSSTNDFVNGVYIDENRWFNVNVCNYIDKWELMVKGKYTAEDNEWKIRWIQNVNPMTATFSEVAVANVTKITNSGGELYGSSPSAWGGLYAKKGSAYLTANNGTNGNWWGAVGSYSVYQNGIPGWGISGTITTTGFNDLYVRIDNIDFNMINASNTKNKIWNASTFIEM